MPIANIPLGARITAIDHERGFIIYYYVTRDGKHGMLKVPR